MIELTIILGSLYIGYRLFRKKARIFSIKIKNKKYKHIKYNSHDINS